MIGWIDASAGASGDMLLGAIVDAGVPVGVLQGVIDTLGLPITLTTRTVTRAALGATKVDVRTLQDNHHRRLRDISALIEPLGPPVAPLALKVFQRLAEAEAHVHRVSVDEVHFHEVGALDAIADITCCVAGLAYLNLTELHCSPVSLGTGMAHGAHGPVPIPGPAVLDLLRGKPVVGGPAPFECTTPTGAALLTTLVTHWGGMPSMTVGGVGAGAGERDPVEFANALRIVIGETTVPTIGGVLLEANVDDLDPRLWPQAIARILAAGASDAWLTPIMMKKGRPAHTLSVLCTAARAADIRSVVFAETSTIGLREIAVIKHTLERSESRIRLDGQSIRTKTAYESGEIVNCSVEWEDVAAAAAALGRPAKQVLADAQALAMTELHRLEAPVHPDSAQSAASPR